MVYVLFGLIFGLPDRATDGKAEPEPGRDVGLSMLASTFFSLLTLPTVSEVENPGGITMYTSLS